MNTTTPSRSPSPPPPPSPASHSGNVRRGTDIILIVKPSIRYISPASHTGNVRRGTDTDTDIDTTPLITETSPASHTGNVRRGTEADADVDTTPSNVNVNVNVNTNADTNTEYGEAGRDTDPLPCSGVQPVPDTEPNTPPPSMAGSGSISTSVNNQKQYIELQNPKKFTIFQNLLRTCDGIHEGRALASKHGIPQAAQRRKHGIVELYRLLAAHTECTDFCLVSASDGALHGIKNAALFTAKELRHKCAVLSPKVTARAKTPKRKAANRLENVAKRSRGAGDSVNTSDPMNWPAPLSWSQKKGLVTEFFETLQTAQKPYTTCDFCGTECLADDAKSYEPDALDISVLEDAAEHARKTLNQPQIVAHRGNKEILHVCPACSTSIKGNVFTTVPPFSFANACWVGDQPDELKDLSYVEQIAIARARGTRCFIKLEKGPLGQSAAVGNVCVLPQEPKHLSNILPPPINELVDEIAVVFVSDASADVKNETLLKSPLLLRRGRILAALGWLQENNPLYNDIEISEPIANEYPEHGALPAPTQHMLPTAGLSGEGASYTSYSGQANIEAFEGNDGPIPIIAQGMMDLDTVGNTYHERKLQAILRLKQGLDPFIKYPSGSTPLPTSYSPKTWAYLWPALFPYGVGAFEDPIRLDTSFGLRKLHFKTHVKRLLFLTDRRFCTHPSFVFVVMNVMQRRASSFSATLATKRTWFGSVQNDLASLSPEVVSALQTKLEKDPAYRPISDEEKTCFRLIKRLQFLSQPVSGSTGEIALYREEIRAACRVYGLPHLYVTINPADSHHPVAQIFTGRNVQLTPQTKLVDAAEKQVRAKMVAANPVAGARFFHFLMTTFFDVLIGNGTKEGIFGAATDHYGIVETQDRGSLHCHMFVWLKGGLSPLQIQAKAEQDAEWSKKYLAWLEDIIKLDFLPEQAPADADVAEQLIVPPTPTFVVGPTPTEEDFDSTWPTYVNNLLRRTGQNHEHGFTCYKHLPKSLRALRDPDKDCRFRLPRPTVKESTFDDDGHVEMKCTNGMMNGYNDIVAGTMACNMDCKSIGSGTAALAMITYVTNYISKMGLDSGLVMSALSGSMKAMEKQKQTATSDPDVVEDSEVQDSATARMVLLKTVNQMIGKRKLSGQQVAAFLCGFPNRYTRGRFEKMFWGPMLRTVLAEFYSVSTYEPMEPNAEGTDAVLEGLVVVQESSEMPGYSSLCSPLAEDYAWRAESLKDVCFWDYICTYSRKKIKKSRNASEDEDLEDENENDPDDDSDETHNNLWPFRSGHMLSGTHGAQRRRYAVIPVLIGPAIPRRDREGDMDKYSATMLMLFKPWEMKDSISFKEDNETWTSAFQTFVSLAPQHITSIMDNMQQLHECHDARDDHSAQRKVREALLRGRSDFTGMDAYEGDADDDEVWLAAMQGNDTTEEGLDFCTSDLNDIIAQRAVDHAMAAGFYDATDGPQYNPGSSLPVEQGGDVAIDRADMAMKRLLAEKERVLQIRKGGDVPTASARTGPSVTSGPTQASSEPTLTTWNAEVENTRQKHMTRRFAGRHWNDLQEHHQWCLTLIEKYSLNEEQCLAFLLICDAEARSKADSLVSPLHLIIGGPGGTGKSQIFKAVQEFFALGSGQNRLKLTAPTGVAASNIGGSTIHSEASLRVSRLKMKHESNRSNLEERWRLVSTCVVDEVSFLSALDMATLNEYLKLAKGHAFTDTHFGGLNMIFVGDMAQLPPPMSRPLFDAHLTSVENVNAGNDTERRAVSGIAAFRSIQKAVVLKTVMRQKDPVFVALLGRLRYGICTEEDKALLDEYVLGTGSKANAANIDAKNWVEGVPSPLISYRNGVRDAHNNLMAEAFATLTGQQLHLYHSLDKVGRGQSQKVLKNRVADAAWSIPPKKAKDLYGRLPLLVGMPVFCTENIATELGISNGSEGIVRSISYFEKEDRRHLISADVDLDAYTSSDTSVEHPHRVVLKPVKQTFTYKIPGSDVEYSATRWQLPLVPAFAYTCHNSQGRSLERATIDLESAATAKDRTALSYVMLSRLRSLEGLTILRPFPMSVINTHASQQVRTELKRVDDLAKVTKSWAEEELNWFYRQE